MQHRELIPVFHMGARLEKYQSHAEKSMQKILENGNLVLGDSNKKFEKLFADFLDVEHVITVASGSDALEIAITSLGLPEGSKIGLPANSGGYATLATLQNRHVPLFCDVDEISSHPTLDSISSLIQNGVKAIIVTHLFGQAIKHINEISLMCKAAGIFLIEDCAQSHGAEIEKRKTGTFGDVGCFSFYPTKNLGALGDAGAIVTNNEELAVRIRSLRTYGWAEKYSIVIPGGRNSRMDELQAEFLSSILPELEIENQTRRTIAGKYSLEIANPKVSLPQWENLDYVGHLFVLRTASRNDLMKHLDENGIGHGIHYPVPDNEQVAWKGKFELSESLSNTQKLSKTILSIPLHPYLENKEVSKVIEAINAF